MKKIYSLLTILCVALSVSAQESKQDSTRNSYKQEFLLSPLSFFIGGFELGYGILKPKSNTRFMAGYYFSESANSYDNNLSNMEGFRVEVQRLFTKPVNGGRRYYVGGYAVYKTIRMDRDRGTAIENDVVRGTALSFGIILGSRHFVADNFFFDLFIGGGPNISLDKTHDDIVHIPIVNPYKSGINPRGGLTFGIAF